MNIQKLRKMNIPDKPGVYFFLGRPKGLGSAKRILYIGKATSLRERTRSYFNKDVMDSRGPLIVQMVKEADTLKWQDTDSVLEALILESNLIKKHQPRYNTKEKDNKSFNYVCITKGDIPKVEIFRGRNLEKGQYKEIFGPYPSGNLLKEAMKIIRRIFPYIDNDSINKQNKEFYDQLKLNPVDLEEYKNNIKNLKLFFEGKKKNIVSNLKKEMNAFAKIKEFEKANELKKRIFALLHINDVALIKEDIFASQNNLNFSRFTQSTGAYTDKNLNNSVSNIQLNNFRLEAYDVAHMSGKNMVGVMTVVENGEIKKSEYKKFIIKSQSGANDTGALEEILSRRLRHTEWCLPSLIVVDGGIAQKNVANQVINRYQFKIPIVSVVKDDRHKAKAIMGDSLIIKKYKREILLANSESHRFAITFHKQKRNKNFIK